MTTPQPAMSRPTLSSLMGRIARLNRLLATLTRLSPASSRRLAPELVTLRSLLKSLLGQVAAPSPATVGQSGQAQRGAGDLLAAPAWAGNAFAATLPIAAAPPIGAISPTGATPAMASSAGQTETTLASATGGSAPASSPRPAASHPAPARPAPPAAGPSQPLQTSTGGLGASAGGSGSGAPGGVAAPVAALVLSLLCALLSRRLGLNGLAWRSALLQLRIERPG
jgi:hypothetical protein